MSVIAEDRIRELLVPFVADRVVPSGLYPALSVYLDLLVRWNSRTNLSAVREPEEIVRRHFGESLFLGKHLPQADTLLDYGSGAGFPGLPIQLLLPALKVTLGESQGKKASFLREVVRELRLDTEVWPQRVEAMPSGRRFSVVALRAVDKMELAVAIASAKVAEHGTLALLLAGSQGGIHIPGSHDRIVQFISPAVFHMEHTGLRKMKPTG